ncbi:MAG TPA: hypothetical protein VG122_16595 [Gemmata sp.]|jgi:hypothetical protein|nr:hypothetical protein [Gemmata sp.]
MQREKRGWVMPILAGCLLAVCAGCSSKSNDKFIPSETRAREALEAALTAWKDGKKPGLIDGTPIPVQAVDSQWLAGKKKLTDYEIVAQEPGEGPPLFSVRLTIQGSSQPIIVRYYVVGKDPLWVYREEDYNAPKGGM